MNRPNLHAGLTRRQLVGLLAASCVSGYALDERAQWPNSEAEAALFQAPLAASLELHRLQALVLVATLAASSHNIQPWMSVIRPNITDIHPDTRRQLLMLDPAGRELSIGLSCKLNNPLIAAHGTGYATEATSPGADIVRVRQKPE